MMRNTVVVSKKPTGRELDPAIKEVVAIRWDEIVSIYEGLAKSGDSKTANASGPDELAVQFNRSIHRLVRDRYEALLEPYMVGARQIAEAENRLAAGITQELYAQVIAERHLARETGIKPPKKLKTIDLDAFLAKYEKA